jgi:hypothetical protein
LCSRSDLPATPIPPFLPSFFFFFPSSFCMSARVIISSHRSSIIEPHTPHRYRSNGTHKSRLVRYSSAGHLLLQPNGNFGPDPSQDPSRTPPTLLAGTRTALRFSAHQTFRTASQIAHHGETQERNL